MAIELLTLALSALNSLREGIKFDREYKGKKLDITFLVKHVLEGRESVLAFVKVTNNSEAPYSITEMALVFGKSRAERVPLNTIIVTSGLIKAKSHTMTYIFKRQNLDDLRILDDDLYLQMNESRSGYVIFKIPKGSIDSVLEAEVEICGGTICT